MAAQSVRSRPSAPARLLTIAVMVGLLCGTLPVGNTASAASADSTVVGKLRLNSCRIGAGRQTWCGQLLADLNPDEAGDGKIQIGFAWLPARHGHSVRTIVAQEGGPGYPSTGTAASYDTMLGQLTDDHNVLVVDARGTGKSTPIQCRSVQSLPQPPKQSKFTAAVAACGDQLNHTFRRVDGGFVHASDLFSTADAVRDLVQVLKALQTGPVDFYGDSYGTFFGQSLLARYPEYVHAAVLDSAYETRGLDPWYRTSVATARQAFTASCHRSPSCARATAHRSDTSWQRIGELAASLRRHPLVGRAVGTTGRLQTVTFDVTALVNIVNDAGYDYEQYRQTDAAVRAYLDHRDPTPLLRLYAQSIGYDYSQYAGPARQYSDGLYLAVACTDYPQLFAMSASPAQRQRQLTAAIARLPRTTFAPFTTEEWLRVLPFTQSYTACLSWPSPQHHRPPVPASGALNPGHVPVLLLNGEFDSLTPTAGGAHIARQLGSTARAVVARNMVHLVALDAPYDCGPRIVRSFFARPAALARLDASCASRIPAIRTMAEFAGTAEQSRLIAGQTPDRIRRLAAVATAAAGDAVIRFNFVDAYRDSGLRGGDIRYRGNRDGSTTATLSAVRWTTDTRLWGEVVGAEDIRAGVAHLVLSDRIGPVGFTVSWDRAGSARVTSGSFVLRLAAP
jgi:pimeloyl-ACP methyl ester carboxylesterase